MKKYIASLLISLVVGCSSTPPEPPQPIGDKSPVNPVNIDLSKLKI